MSLRSVEVKPLVSWLASQLHGSALQAIQHTDPNTLVLRLRQPGLTTHLLLATGNGRSRLHTVEKAPPAPTQPLPFQGLLRKHLHGQLVRMEMVDEERIIRLRFEESSGKAHCLVAELTDRHGNFFLLDESDTILGSARTSSSTVRQLKVSQAWQPPKPHSGPTEDRYHGQNGAARNQTIRDHYNTLDANTSQQGRRTAFHRMLRGRLKGLEKLLARQEAEASRGNEAVALRQEGDLLQSAFHRLERGQSEIMITDFFDEDGVERCLVLDPSLSPSEQLEARYKSARRAKRSSEQAGVRADATRALVTEIRQLQELADELIDGDPTLLTEKLPTQLRREWSRVEPTSEHHLSGTSKQERRKKQRHRRLPYRSYSSPSGHEIRVGRGARDNDELTLRLSRGNDLFLHVRGRPGAHVIVCRPGKNPSPALLLLAAQLALANSGIGDGDRAEVLWTRVKEVRKPRGMAPGAVLLRSEKVLYVEASREVLDQLVPLKH